MRRAMVPRMPTSGHHPDDRVVQRGRARPRHPDGPRRARRSAAPSRQDRSRRWWRGPRRALRASDERGRRARVHRCRGLAAGTGGRGRGGLLDVLRHDAAAGAGADQRGEVDAELAGDALGVGRGKQPAGPCRRTRCPIRWRSRRRGRRRRRSGRGLSGAATPTEGWGQPSAPPRPGRGARRSRSPERGPRPWRRRRGGCPRPRPRSRHRPCRSRPSSAGRRRRWSRRPRRAPR